MFLKADLSPRMHLLPGAAVANCHKFGDSLSSRRPGDQNRDSGRSASRAAASGGSGGGSSSASSSSWGLRPLPRRRGALSSVSAVPREDPGRGTESTIRDEPAFPLGVPESGSTRDSAPVGDVQGVGLTHGYSAERPAPPSSRPRHTAQLPLLLRAEDIYKLLSQRLSSLRHSVTNHSRQAVADIPGPVPLVAGDWVFAGPLAFPRPCSPLRFWGPAFSESVDK